MANRAIRYRLYPNTEQKTFFANTFGCCRKVYNLMLEDKIKGYESNGVFPSVTPAMYKKNYPFLREVDSLALANVQMNLQTAFRNCFDKKRKKRNGFPKFKSAKHSRKSYTTNNQKGTVSLCGNAVRLPKIGKVKAVLHRLPPEGWKIKSATVSQEADDTYYVSVLFEYNDGNVRIKTEGGAHVILISESVPQVARCKEGTIKVYVEVKDGKIVGVYISRMRGDESTKTTLHMFFPTCVGMNLR